jgi:hypothetical protein
MTQNQIAYLQAMETARANAANEEIKRESNELTRIDLDRKEQEMENAMIRFFKQLGIDEDLAESQIARDDSTILRNEYMNIIDTRNADVSEKRADTQNFVDRITKIQDGKARSEYHAWADTANRDDGIAADMYASKDRGAIATNTIFENVLNALGGVAKAIAGNLGRSGK